MRVLLDLQHLEKWFHFPHALQCLLKVGQLLRSDECWPPELEHVEYSTAQTLLSFFSSLMTASFFISLFPYSDCSCSVHNSIAEFKVRFFFLSAAVCGYCHCECHILIDLLSARRAACQIHIFWQMFLTWQCTTGSFHVASGSLYMHVCP